MTPTALRSLRSLNLTQRQFAALIDYSPEEVCRWGKARPQPVWVALLLRAWEMCPEALADAPNDKTTQART